MKNRWIGPCLCAFALLSPTLVGHAANEPAEPRSTLEPHGGGHLPPPPTPAPNPGPSPPNQPPAPGTGRPTRGGGGGGGGGGRPSPATPGPSAPGPAGPMGSSPIAPTTLPGGGYDPTSWTVWWKLNRHAFLDLRKSIWAGGTITGDDEFFLGQGVQDQSTGVLRPSTAQLAEIVGPALRRVMKYEKQPEVLSGCLTAFAKLGEHHGGEGQSSAVVLGSFLGSASQQIRETAALSLGILGGPTSLRMLTNLLAANADGRKLSAGRKISERTRAFAAYGLGIFGQRTQRVDLRRYAVHQLVQALDEEQDSLEIATACVNALGMIEIPSRALPEGEQRSPMPPAASSEALVAYLLERFDDRDLSDRARGHLPRAIARVARSVAVDVDAQVFGALLDPVSRHKAHDREVVYGAIAALGAVERAPDLESDKAIRRQLERSYASGDLLARNLALIALAKVSSRRDSGPGAAQEARERLMKVLSKGKSRERPWAAMALGIQGHRLRALGIPLSDEVNHALRLSLIECGSPTESGAYAIALGLRGAVQSAGAVLEKLESIREDEARGNMALALGMMRDRASGERLRELLEEALYRPKLIRSLAVALALLDDKSLVPALVEGINQTKSSSVRAVYAWSLAHVGDARAIDPLVELLEDPEQPTLTRGIAALGLGITCELTLLPWNAELAEDANYLAASPGFFNSQGGGALNIR